jgi:hypothetical protein
MTLSAAISKNSKRSVFLTDSDPREFMNTGIQISVQSEDENSWRVATSGGVLRFWSDVYYLSEQIHGLTVAHVFEVGDEIQSCVAEDTEVAFDEYINDDEPSAGTDSEEETIRSHDEFGLASCAIHSQAPLTKSPPLHLESQSVELPRDSNIAADAESSALPTQDDPCLKPVTKRLEHLGSLGDPPIHSKEHDWALIDFDPRLESITTLDALYSEENVPIYDKSAMVASEVWVDTGKNIGVQGRGQSSLCAIKTKGSATFVDVWAAQLCQENPIGVLMFSYLVPSVQYFIADCSLYNAISSW